MKTTKSAAKSQAKSTTKKTAARKPAARKPAKAVSKNPKNDSSWTFRLYVAGQTPRSVTAFANLKRLCEEQLPGRYNIEVIDLVKQPHRAQSDQIVALPALVRKLPEPIKRIVGDLSNSDRVMLGMEFFGTSEK